MKFFIPVILGTGREGRQSEKAARFVLGEVAARADIETEFIDVRDYARPVTKRQKDGASQDALGQKFARADGFIIVSPEYNHGYPGEMKLMLDTFFREYAKKPVAICGVSGGGLGGARVVEQLRLVAIEFSLVPTRAAVYFSGICSLFNDDGSINDSSFGDRVRAMLDELVWYAEALRAARDKAVAE